MNFPINFFYKNKKYPFDLTLFKKKSNYFSKRKGIKENDIFLLIDQFDSFQDITEDSIISFINFCQNKEYTITNSNVIQINYLSTKYQVNLLRRETEDYIRHDHKKIIQEFLPSQTEENQPQNVQNSQNKKTRPNSNDDRDDDDDPRENLNTNNNNDDENDSDSNKETDDDKMQLKKIKIRKTPNKKKRKTKNKKRIKNQEAKNQDENKSEKESTNKDEDKSEIEPINQEEKKPEKKKQIYIPEIYEHIISDQFSDYISERDNVLLMFPISNLYRIMVKYSSNNFQRIQNSNLKDEIDIKIVTFLFDYVLKHGIEATVLLTIFDFGKEGIELFNEKLCEYHDLIDLKYIDSKIFRYNHFLYKTKEQEMIDKMKRDKIQQEELMKSEIDKVIGYVDQMKFNFDTKIQELQDKIKLQEQEINEKNLIICKNIQNRDYFQIPKEIQEKSLSKIVIPSTITTIESKIFSECTFIKEIIIPSSITKIEERAFKNCSSLTQIKIPSSVKLIKSRAFDHCSSLITVDIDLYETNLQQNAFKGCSNFEHIIISSENETIRANNFKQLFEGIRTIKKISFSPNITKILDNTFSECSTLEQIEISPSIVKIGDNVFQKCSSLKQITIPSSINEIGVGVFSECSSLENLEIPSSVKHIGNRAFNQCVNLVQLTIDLYETKFENDSFNECSKFEKIVIDSENEIINVNDFQHLFQRIGTITKISFSSKITQISDSSFEGCSLLKEVIIPSSIKLIGNRSFAKCSSLTDVTFDNPSSLTSIGMMAFFGCLSLRQITIPSSITEILNGVFYECSSLTRVEIPPSVTLIGESSFYECSSLNEINIPSSVKKICRNAFNGCRSLEQITIPDSVTKFANYHFNKDLTFDEIRFPIVAEIFRKSIFNGCSSLKRLNIKNIDICSNKILNIDAFRFNRQIDDSSNTSIYVFTEERTEEEYVFKVFHPNLIEKLSDFINLMNSIPNNIIGTLEIISYRFPLDEDDLIEIIKNELQYSDNVNLEFLNSYITVTKFMKNKTIDIKMREYFNSQRKADEVINPTIRSKLIYGVAAIMKKLHDRNIFNIDLSNNNIYFDDNYEPKIGIFSLSRYLSSLETRDRDSIIINYEYIAPENFGNSSEYQKPADVFAFSIFLYKMFSSEVSLPNDFNSSQRIDIQQRPRRPENIPDIYWNLINDCWNNTPSQRPTFENIVNALKNDEYAIQEFGLTTNLNQLHEYQNRIDL